MKKTIFLILICSVSLLIVGCGKQNIEEVCSLTGWATCWIHTGTIDHSNLSWVIDDVLQALKKNDFQTLSTFVWPQGLRFSPYEYVHTGTDVVLDTQILSNALIISRSYVWGISDGKWDPIDLWIGQYFEQFVNDADWIQAPEITYNKITQRGNTTNNIAEVYKNKQRVEFYFSGFDKQYEGMDRKSLTLVFEQNDGQRYLIGIVHGQRTI